MPSTSVSVIRSMWLNSFDIYCHPCLLEAIYEMSRTLFKLSFKRYVNLFGASHVYEDAQYFDRNVPAGNVIKMEVRLAYLS